MRHGRGIRDRVRGFSRESRTNLLRRLASINRGAFKAFKGRMIFVTLTYPGEYPQDPVVCKRDLKALRRRSQRKFGEFAGFWRLGIQKRGALHLHLLLFVGPSIGPVRELRRFISSSWYEVTGRVSGGHLRAGVWNAVPLPVRWETIEVSLQDAFRIRRIYRKLARKKGSGSLRRMTVFVRHENVLRLLEFFGYRLE